MQAVRLFALLFLVSGVAVAQAEAQTLRGSRASVDRIHGQALRHGLTFHENAASVKKSVAAGHLVRLEGNRDFHLEGVSYPYVLPVTATFVKRLGAQYRAACGERMVVTSAMRPQTFRLINSVDKSVHPTGMAVDLRKPRKAGCLTWLRSTLLAMEASGAIEAVEERNPPHFHVAVFPTPYRQYVRGQGEGGEPVAAARPASAKAGGKAPTASRTTYKVRRGDSLWSIARRHGQSVEAIKKANRMNSSRIVVDQVLVIPQTAR